MMSVLAIFMLVAISYATAVNTNTINNDEKESPLYGIRTKRAITEKIGNIIESIKTKFLGDRIFFLPFNRLIFRYNLDGGEYPSFKKTEDCVTLGPFTCIFTCSITSCLIQTCLGKNCQTISPISC